MCIGKLCFKGQRQADSFLVEFIFISGSHINHRDKLQIVAAQYRTYRIREEKRKVL